MSFEELIFNDTDIQDMMFYIREPTREFKEICPNCACDLCKEIKLLLIMLGITSKYAIQSLSTDANLKLVAITIKQNEKYFPKLFSNLKRTSIPKLQENIERIFKELANLIM